MLQLLSQICTIQETKPDNELCTIQLLFQLWNILQKNMDWTSDSNSIHRLNHKQARLQAMMQYIHDHYMDCLLYTSRCCALHRGSLICFNRCFVSVSSQAQSGLFLLFSVKYRSDVYKRQVLFDPASRHKKGDVNLFLLRIERILRVSSFPQGAGS